MGFLVPISKSGSSLRARGSNGKFASNTPGYQAVSVESRGKRKVASGDPKERSHSVGRRLR